MNYFKDLVGNLTSKEFFQRNKITLLLILALIFILGSGGIVFNKFFAKNAPKFLEEVELSFDPEGPYALLTPRKDGNALNLIIRRASSYEAFSYELVYQADGIDRGAGDKNTFVDFDKSKSEYNQEILFGTCSQGYTDNPSHCVFDKGVENGTLAIYFKRDNKLYRMLSTWHLQKPDVALGVITSGDNHFNYKTRASREELTLVGYTIVNDLYGLPKLPEKKQVLGKVYTLNLPPARTMPKGEVKIELSEDPSSEAKIARYVESKNSWEVLETKISGSNLTANAEGAGIFAVLVTASEE